MTAVASVQTDHGIRLEALAKTFRGPRGPIHAVREIDVSIAAGETAALLGPNGAGKSTTIDMLLGLAKPDRGTVSVFGRRPARGRRRRPDWCDAADGRAYPRPLSR